jgi:hypothetical protein
MIFFYTCLNYPTRVVRVSDTATRLIIEMFVIHRLKVNRAVNTPPQIRTTWAGIAPILLGCTMTHECFNGRKVLMHSRVAPSEPSVSGQTMNVAGQQHDYMARVSYLGLSGLGSFLNQAPGCELWYQLDTAERIHLNYLRDWLSILFMFIYAKMFNQRYIKTISNLI